MRIQTRYLKIDKYFQKLVVLSYLLKYKPIILLQELSSEERFHVELHFSPGAKGCEEDKNLPSGYGYRPASREVMIMPFYKAKLKFFWIWTYLK